LRHGFKAQAERLSGSAREALGAGALDPLSPWAYAGHLGVLVLDFEELGLAEAHRVQLLEVDPESWSGMTLREGKTHAIVINPVHSSGRRASTLMHELSHIVLRHVPARIDVSPTGLLLLSDYSDEQEDEADWLSAALLLPREALVRARSRGLTVHAIAEHFGTSDQLCEWRLRMTGVDLQLRRAGRR
jgi:Zn-dependent peptidase ImmA (M78 family)